MTNSFEEAVIAHLHLNGKEATNMRGRSKVCIEEMKDNLNTETKARDQHEAEAKSDYEEDQSKKGEPDKT